MDIEKQISYWITGAEEDFAAARSLFEKGHLRHCLFLAHLAVEKRLKAHVIRQTKDVPPKLHNLIRLAQIAKLKLQPQQEQFLREFGIYQLEGRYPDAEQMLFDRNSTEQEMSRVGEMLKWLNSQ
jgi:HEPN domain-containing protein